MSHKSSGRPPPIGPPPPPPPIECPLASLGRNTPSASGGPGAIYHHPLSTSPVYQMTRQQSPLNVMSVMPGTGSTGVGGDGCGGHSDSSDEEHASSTGLQPIGGGGEGGGGGGGVGQRHQQHPPPPRHAQQQLQQPPYRTHPPPITMRTNYTPIEAILAYHDRLSPVQPGEVRSRQQPPTTVAHPAQPSQHHAAAQQQQQQQHNQHQHQHPHRHQHPSSLQQQQQQQHHHQHRHRQLHTSVQQPQPAAPNTYYLEPHSNLHRINQRRPGHAATREDGHDADDGDDDVDDEVVEDDTDDDDDDDDDDARVVDLQPVDDTSVYNMLRHHRHHRHPPHPHPHTHRHPTGNVAASSRNHSTERYFLEDQPIAATEAGGSGLAAPLRPISPTYLLHRPSSPSETSGSDRYHIGRGSRASPAILSHQYQQLSFGGVASSAELAGGCKSRAPHQQQLQQQQQQHQHLQMTSMGDESAAAHSSTGFMRFSPNLDQGYATLVSPSSPASSGGSHIHTPAMTTPASRLNVGSISGAGHPGAEAWQRYAKPALLSSSHQPAMALPSSLIDLLDDNLLTNVLRWLESSELATVSRVCRRFEVVAWRPTLWRHIVLKGEQTCGDRALKAIFRRLCGQSRTGCCAEVEQVMLSDGCRMTDRGMQLVSRRCPELTHLQLQNCAAVTNGALFDLVTKCGNLQHLDITGCSLVTTINFNAGFDPPRRLLLQYLDLTDCCVINDDGLKTIVRNCPQLLYLYLRRCLQITDAGLRFVPSFCAALRELSVSDCAGITDFGLYELAKLGATLRYLSVAKCDQVSDAGLKVIARRCYKLRYLNARGCEAVSDDSIVVLAASCPRLRALDIGKCDVSDAGLRALAESCPNLKKLSLKNCDMITDRGVQCIAYYCRGLQQLNIQDCQVSVDGYRAVKRFCKRCVIEHTNPGFC